ncbi:dual specificity calcium/calmodulin-dependent 3',5'-cyclic nucleotide phosphodiesterase 1A-like isoform X2 [Petromyzon marinus]|uniref:dual specificity calcium/calmodulin-dependent 3',5'-cyclic nucleotide phosphodiesterase 1A-like isoform X2 n=1 Tax=Petromyzon marinus TaxID=7757 RepID=UPI003F6EF667
MASPHQKRGLFGTPAPQMEHSTRIIKRTCVIASQSPPTRNDKGGGVFHSACGGWWWWARLRSLCFTLTCVIIVGFQIVPRTLGSSSRSLHAPRSGPHSARPRDCVHRRGAVLRHSEPMGSAISARRSAVGPTSRKGGGQATVTVREPSSTSSMPASRGRDPGNLHERAVAKEHYDAEGRRPLERFRRTQSHSSIRGPSAQQEKGATKQQHLLVPGGGEWGAAGGDRGHGGGRADDRDPAQVLAEEPPPCDSPEALERAAVRLRCLLKQLERGELPVADLKKNLDYAASVLEAVYMEDNRRLLDPEDELGDLGSEAVPTQVRDWLASTFTSHMGLVNRRPEDKPSFRSIVHAVQAGIFVERMYRRSSSMTGLSYPPGVISVLKDVDKWSFDIFALNEASGEHALKFTLYETLTRYDLIARFKIPISSLVSFADALEAGYSKYKNPYHNLMHAADVTQTVHFLLLKTGFMHWLNELEIFAMLFAAAIHDLEHTGTTNNFHIQTRSDVAILYNDRSVMENHHVSTAYRIMQADEDANILINLSKDDWRELRALVVEMVLATDMSCHFQQIKAMKTTLQQPDSVIDKPKAMSLIVHTSDISHPAKEWRLHRRWTESLLEEFFQQGDREEELGLPFSPLCDRKSTMVPQSQVGFIDFIVEPTLSVLTDMVEGIVAPLVKEAVRAASSAKRRSSVGGMEVSQRGGKASPAPGSVLSVDIAYFGAAWRECIVYNKERWKQLDIIDQRLKKGLSVDKAADEEDMAAAKPSETKPEPPEEEQPVIVMTPRRRARAPLSRNGSRSRVGSGRSVGMGEKATNGKTNGSFSSTDDGDPRTMTPGSDSGNFAAIDDSPEGSSKGQNGSSPSQRQLPLEEQKQVEEGSEVTADQ